MAGRTPPMVMAALGAAYLAAVLVTALYASRDHREPARCPDSQKPVGPRCCGRGQRLNDGECVGLPQSCGAHLDVLPGPNAGCAARPSRVFIPGGSLVVGPIDWEAEGVVARRNVIVASFLLDSIEVSQRRWQACVAAHRCPPLPNREPGRPVTGISAHDAASFCSLAGGRLPSGDEWMFAAVGPESQRFPWGNSGLVCRRAAFGLTQGPCANGGTGPDVGGNRPAGATAHGLHDLAGNVAEWTREADGGVVARGGSYRSRRAAELKGWSYEVNRGPAAHIGFRCAYDAEGSAAARAVSTE